MKKLNLLLASFGAAALLAGATFAAWAVTDNADPIGVKVTPGTLQDDGTKYVTLKWGESTKLSNVEEIKPSDNRKVGVIELLTDGETYLGDLHVAITDLTTGKQADEAFLKDYIAVTGYFGVKDLELKPDAQPTDEPTELPSSNDRAFEIAPQYSLEKKDRVYETTKSVEGFKHAIEQDPQSSEPVKYEGNKLTLFVTLDGASSPVFNEIKSDVIRLDVDWNAKSGELRETNTIYYSLPSSASDLCAYAWKDSTFNAEFPGVKMIQDRGSLYKVEVPINMENIVFSWGDHKEPNKTTDIVIGTYNPLKPYWNGSVWAAIPEVTDVVYKVVGDFKGVAEGKEWKYEGGVALTRNEECTVAEEYQLVIDLDKGDEFKVADSDGKWYPDGGDNFKVTANGVYVVSFRPAGNDYWLNRSFDVKIKDPVQLVGHIAALEGSDFFHGYAMEYEETPQAQFVIKGVYLDTTDEVKIRAVWNREVWEGFSLVEEGAKTLVLQSAPYVHEGEQEPRSDDNIMVKEAGYYNIYWKTNDLSNPNIWIEKGQAPQA